MVKNSATLMEDITEIFMDELSAVKDAPDILPSLVYQPMTTAITSHFLKNGGNALGISDRDGPLNCASPPILTFISSITEQYSDQPLHFLVLGFR